MQKRTKKKRRKQTRRSWWRIWTYIPAWALWTGGLLMAFLYVSVFYYFFVDPFSFRWKALFNDTNIPEGYSIVGIDISHYQESIDWEKLQEASIKGSPISFVIIKATEGVSLLDNCFNDNFYQAYQYGIIRGAYHFFVPSLSAEKQANYFLKQVHLEDGDLPPVLDIEHAGKLSKQQVKEAALTWLRIVEKHYGVKPIIYAGYSFKMQYLNDKEFADYPYWIAHYYVDKLRYQGQWKFWQYTDYGNIQGIHGKVDCNVYNGSLYSLQQLTIGSKE